MKKIDAPLYNAVSSYAKTAPVRFHMPGHKGKFRCGLYKSAPYDVTELDFSDDLLNARGVILEAEKKLAEVYGVDRAFMCTGGATSGLFSVLGAIKAYTDKVILSKNTHKSVFNAMSVLGIKPCFLEVDYRDGLPLPVSVDRVAEGIKNYPEAGAVLVTTPDYFGNVCDVEGIKNVIGDRLFVVDSAHGAHFVYADDLTCRAELSADMVVLSAHKTLPCFTGSAIITCRNEYAHDIMRARKLFHTSSPQYLCMISMDYTRAVFSKNKGHGYKKIQQFLKKYKFSKLNNHDYTKLVLRGGEKLSERLKKNGIYPECVCGDHVVLILTPGDEKYLKKVSKIANQRSYETIHEQLNDTIRLEKACEFSDCVGVGVEEVLIDDSVGRVLADEVGLYPPGVPLFFRGERISVECKEFMIKNKKRLFGVDSEYVNVLK